MPCYYTGSEAGDARLAASEARQALTAVTATLCATCEYLEKNHPAAFREIPELRAFWIRHQEVDRERKERAAKYAQEQRQRTVAEIARLQAELDGAP